MDFVNSVETPFYIYDEEVLQRRINNLKAVVDGIDAKILYACKANNNPYLLRTIKEQGIGFEAVSIGEVRLALKLGFKAEDILFTQENANLSMLKEISSSGVLMSVSSFSQLEKIEKNKLANKVCIRINPDVGAGHHRHVITGGRHTKFGIPVSQINELKDYTNRHGIKVIGFHAHIGSGFLEIEPYIQSMDYLLNIAKEWDDIQFINAGGGIGITYKQGEAPIPLTELGQQIKELINKFNNENNRTIKLLMEPGRYIVGECGFLIARVNMTKKTASYFFAGVDSGFNHLIRPVLYSAYHPICNLTNRGGTISSYIIAGNLCETGDVFTQNQRGYEPRLIQEIRENDILAIGCAGAYGYSMSSNYNLIPRPAEYIITKSKEIKKIRNAENIDEIIDNMINV